MKLELIGHDEKYAVEQSLLTLFPDERPVYGPVTDEDASAARITLTEDADSVCVTTELRCGGKAAADCYSYPLSGTDYEKEGQRRHALGLSFFRAAKEVLGVTPAWGSLTGVRPSKVAVSLLREGKAPAAVLTELEEVYSVTPQRARLALEAAETGLRVQNDLKPNDISLYVGIPFCPTRCAYCSFVAQSVEKSFALVEPYLAALFDEIEQAGAMVRSLGLHIKSLLQYCYLLKIAIVSEAIISSSSVGITTTFTLESSVEITASSPRTLFFSKSTLMPINSRPSHTSLRQLHWFSPTPPVNTMISTPPKAAA